MLIKKYVMEIILPHVFYMRFNKYILLLMEVNMYWVLIFILSLVIYFLVDFIDKYMSHKLFIFLVITIFSSSFYVNLFFPEIGLIMFWSELIILHYKSSNFTNKNITKSEKYISNVISFVVLVLILRLIEREHLEIRLISVFMFISFYYMFIYFYSYDVSIKEDFKKIFKNMNYYFYAFIISGAIFLSLAFYYKETNQNILLSISSVFAIAMIPLFYYGLAETYEKAINKLQSDNQKQKEVNTAV